MMAGLPLAAGWITPQEASEALVAKDFVLPVHLLAIGVYRYLIVYKAWRSHRRRSINIYSDLYSILQIRKWNHHTDPVRKNLESVYGIIKM